MTSAAFGRDEMLALADRLRAWRSSHGLGFDFRRDLSEAETVLRAAPAREEPQPVAWQKRNEGNDWAPVIDISDESLDRLKRAGWQIRPLYAAPVRPEVRAALEPFAKAADNYADCQDDKYIDEDATVTVANLREARAALSADQSVGEEQIRPSLIGLLTEKSSLNMFEEDCARQVNRMTDALISQFNITRKERT